MAYDPDLYPVLDALRSAQADHGARLAVLGTGQADQGSRLAALDAAQADQDARLDALERRPQPDLAPLIDQLAGVLARVAKLEAAAPIVVTPPVETPAPIRSGPCSSRAGLPFPRRCRCRPASTRSTSP